MHLPTTDAGSGPHLYLGSMPCASTTNPTDFTAAWICTPGPCTYASSTTVFLLGRPSGTDEILGVVGGETCKRNTAGAADANGQQRSARHL